MISKIHPIPAFQDNYIWIFTNADETSACVVDPGDPAPVQEYLETRNLKLTDILVTHHHPDHVGGLAKLIETYSPRVIGPALSQIPGISEFVKEDDTVSVFDELFTVLEVPGHTLDHLAYFSGNSNTPFLFCGDTLFAAGCGRLFEGTPQMMQKSLAKFTNLPSQTKVYCTHEYTMANLRFAFEANPNNQDLISRMAVEQEKRNNDTPTLPSTIELELLTNPFLRCHDPDLQESVARNQEISLSSEQETFVALRRWKDNF